MTMYYNGKKVQKAYYNGKSIQVGYYNGIKVFSLAVPPAPVPSTAKTIFDSFYSVTRAGTALSLDPVQDPTAVTTKQFRDAARKFTLSLGLEIDDAGKNLDGLDSISLKLGDMTGDLPLAGSVITRINTMFSYYKMETIYVVIDGVFWCSFNMNGVGKLERTTANIPASAQYTGTEVYRKEAEYYDQLKMYSSPDGATPAKFKAAYDALLAKIADGTTELVQVQVYWS